MCFAIHVSKIQLFSTYLQSQSYILETVSSLLHCWSVLSIVAGTRHRRSHIWLLTGHICKSAQACTCSIMSSMECGRLASLSHCEIDNDAAGHCSLEHPNCIILGTRSYHMGSLNRDGCPIAGFGEHSFSSGCSNQEIGWPFIFQGLIIGAFSYFSADFATYYEIVGYH
jgi:hypothetical protein